MLEADKFTAWQTRDCRFAYWSGCY